MDKFLTKMRTLADKFRTGNAILKREVGKLNGKIEKTRNEYNEKRKERKKLMSEIKATTDLKGGESVDPADVQYASSMRAELNMLVTNMSRMRTTISMIRMREMIADNLSALDRTMDVMDIQSIKSESRRLEQAMKKIHGTVAHMNRAARRVEETGETDAVLESEISMTRELIAMGVPAEDAVRHTTHGDAVLRELAYRDQEALENVDRAHARRTGARPRDAYVLSGAAEAEALGELPDGELNELNRGIEDLIANFSSLMSRPMPELDGEEGSSSSSSSPLPPPRGRVSPPPEDPGEPAF